MQDVTEAPTTAAQQKSRSSKKSFDISKLRYNEDYQTYLNAGSCDLDSLLRVAQEYGCGTKRPIAKSLEV